jgi:hypothetical protein
MLCMCVCMHSRFIENHLIQILEDRLLISKVVLSQLQLVEVPPGYPVLPGRQGNEVITNECGEQRVGIVS